MKPISWQDFEKVELRAGTISRVEDFPEANTPAYKIWADFGDFGLMKSSAQITKLYGKADLRGRQFAPALLGFQDLEDVQDVPSPSRRPSAR